MPFQKVTVPVGVPVPGAAGLIVAVRVIDCPKVVETGEAVSVALVLSDATFNSEAVLGLEAKLAAPLYWAVSESAPTGSVEICRAALSFAPSGTGWPTAAPLS